MSEIKLKLDIFKDFSSFKLAVMGSEDSINIHNLPRVCGRGQLIIHWSDDVSWCARDHNKFSELEIFILYLYRILQIFHRVKDAKA